MKYITVYDHLTDIPLAFLENAYSIGYELHTSELDTATFTLPFDDYKNKFCKPLNFVEIFDGDERVGLFRIVPSDRDYTASTKEVTYRCEGALATLMDDFLFGWHEIGNIGVTTQQVLRYILDRQSVKRWQLRQCDFTRQFLYGWENENLLAALFSVPQPFGEEYRLELDTTGYPQAQTWGLSLVKVSTEPVAEIRYEKNMQGIHKHVDPSLLTTRLYPLGYGEGSNQLTIRSVNGGVPYIQSDTVAQYGLISKPWVDRRYQNADSLLAAARTMLEELKTPHISYEVEALHLYDLQKARPGDRVRIYDIEDDTQFTATALTLAKSDVSGDSQAINLALANKPRGIADTIADISNRQRINDTYAQGATNLYCLSFADNADQQNPARFELPIPAEVTRINAVLLKYKLTPFRSYQKGVESAAAKSTSTSSGGGSSQTSSSGGGGSQTSSSGGSSSPTSDSAGAESITSGSSSRTTSDNGLNETVNTGYAYKADYDPNQHYHTIAGVYLSHSHSIQHTHSVTTPSHRHDVKISGHTHNVNIPSHSHSVSIPPHSHGFTIPAHGHSVQYGIYNGATAGSATVKVDGKAISASSVGEIDISPYLQVDGGGKIIRTWHTIEIVPNALTRIEAAVSVQLFLNSRGAEGDL